MVPGETATLTVDTSSGVVRGFLDRGVPNWRGVPYGTVEARFRPATAATPAGPIDASRWGPVSWQVPMGLSRERWSPLHRDAVKSEHCLNLNIWAPGPDRSGPRPVLVWIHPGRHMVGGNMTTADPRVFAAEHDVVIVTVNFRLGPWGWLHLGTVDAGFGDCVNLAVQDQLLALKWVQHNIAAFGGDPRNVTLFGLSTGGSDVLTLLGVPRARGLFHKAAIYSGSARNALVLADASRIAGKFLEAGGPLASDPAQLGELSNVALRYVHLQALRQGLVRYEAVVDGDLIPRPPLDVLGDGHARDIPLLVSVTSDEAGVLDVVTGPAVDLKYAGFADPDDGTTHEERVDLLSDRLYYRPARQVLEAVTGSGGQCWSMVFDHHPATSQLARVPSVAGRAVHGVDIAALFHDIGDTTGSHADHVVAVAEQRALVGLARDGDPGWRRHSPGSPLARWLNPELAGDDSALRRFPGSHRTD